MDMKVFDFISTRHAFVISDMQSLALPFSDTSLRHIHLAL